MIEFMNTEIKKIPEHACQHCGAVCKLVETLIDDEFHWSETDKMYQPHKYTDAFEHTGNERCAECGEGWTGF
jgi:hypothetical protein